MRIKQLDILRGVAIWLVLGRHMPFMDIYSGLGCGFLKLWERMGWIGVDLFFVLSGFLVSGLLFREYQSTGGIDLRLFLIRRGFKIYPGYYFLILVTLLVYFCIFNRFFSARVIWEQVLFLQNYCFLLWGHTWSLAVEEHFYFFLAFFLLWCSRRRIIDPFSDFPRVFVLVAMACLVLRVHNSVLRPEFVAQSHLFLTHLRIDSLMFGTLLSYAHHFHGEKFREWILANKRIIAGLSVLMLLPVFLFELQDTPFIYTYGLTLNYLGLGGLMMVFLYGVHVPDGRFNVLAWTGLFSYSIYLWHFPVIHWIVAPLSEWTGKANETLLVLIVLYFLLTFNMGIWTARVIEIPFLNYRDRAFVRKKGTEAV